MKFNKNILIADIELQLLIAKKKVKVADELALKAFHNYEKAETVWNDKEVELTNMKKWVHSLSAKLNYHKKRNNKKDENK